MHSSTMTLTKQTRTSKKATGKTTRILQRKTLAFYTFFIPEETDADQLKLWTALLDAAWAVREPLASVQEKRMYKILRSIMSHACFDMPAVAIADHCRILCMKLGVRCNPNHFCAHYQHNAGAEEAGNSGQLVEPLFKRPKEPLCKLSAEEDPLIN